MYHAGARELNELIRPRRLPKLTEALARGARVASYWFPMEGLGAETRCR